MKNQITISFVALLAMGAIHQCHAQTVTNVGPGLAGNGATATTQRYAIDISEDGAWLIINGKWYGIHLQKGQSATDVNIEKWDAFKNQFVPYGVAKVQSLDGKQTLTGLVHIRSIPTFKVGTFKLIGYVTPPPDKTPTTAPKGIVAVYVYSRITGTFVPRPDYNYTMRRVDGAVWLNSDYTFHSAVFNYFEDGGWYQLQVIPPPGGPGGHNSNGVYPLNIM